VKGYIFATHYGKLATGDDIKVALYTQIWQASANGTERHELLNFDVGGHGCQLSPDGQYLACLPCANHFDKDDKKHPLPPNCERNSDHGAYCPGIVITSTNPVGPGPACIQGDPGEWVPENQAPIWRPDSKGFLYFSINYKRDPSNDDEAWASADRAFLLYFDMKNFCTGPYTPTKRITPENVETHWFCAHDGKSCVNAALNGVRAGENPAWVCVDGNPCKSWQIYLAANFPARSKKVVIGIIPFEGPYSFQPVSDQDALGPAFSADGSLLSFLAFGTKPQEHLQQIWVMDLGKDGTGRRPYQLTHFTPKSKAHPDSPAWLLR
jgi:hypothetical protein